MIYEATAGECFRFFIIRMKSEMVSKRQSYRQCVFNDIMITVSSDSNIDDIAVIYDLKRKLQN